LVADQHRRLAGRPGHHHALDATGQLVIKQAAKCRKIDLASRIEGRDQRGDASGKLQGGYPGVAQKEGGCYLRPASSGKYSAVSVGGSSSSRHGAIRRLPTSTVR